MALATEHNILSLGFTGGSLGEFKPLEVSIGRECKEKQTNKGSSYAVKKAPQMGLQKDPKRVDLLVFL
tara:strand:+ start:658 stop:861 length:204 start_codon:yes stop_codon:yes gene_type:complete